MPQACATCHHPERTAIEAALDRGEPLRAIAAAYGLSRSGLSRHAADHMPAGLVVVRIRPELAAWLDEQGDPGATVEAALEHYREQDEEPRPGPPGRVDEPQKRRPAAAERRADFAREVRATIRAAWRRGREE